MSATVAQAFTPPQDMKKFSIIWLGELISIVGSGLTSFALGVWIYQQTGQATPFALTILFGSLPRILLTPVAGSLADRWNRRWLMILADSGDALVTLVVVLLLAFHGLEVWNIYLIALFEAVFAAFQEPAYTASITMLVPKKDLARASGMVQMGQAAENLISPLLAGFLFVAIGLKGIILIDFATYFFAIGALLMVKIPQPESSRAETGTRKNHILSDAAFGWNYLRLRAGLFGLLLYFALVNFLVNFAAVLYIPLILAFTTASVLGVIQTFAGTGMLAGSILMSAWGGPKQRIRGVIAFITLAALGLLVAGLRPSAWLIAAGMFILMFCVPLASGLSQAVFQTKVAPEVQGRVFAIRSMISRSIMPLAFLTAGPLADHVFNPLLQLHGPLAGTTVGRLLGVGSGRGIGLTFVIAGLSLVIASLLAYANPRIRLVEADLPDVIPDAAPGAEETALNPAPAD
jgi:DHA3 family macrolide efflux protein-like MFS transporter